MIWDSFLSVLVALAWFALLWTAGAILFALLGKLRRWLPSTRLARWIRSRRAGRRRAPTTGRPAPSPLPEPAGWSAALLVRPAEGVLEPSVQLRGQTLPGPARIRVDLIDGGTLRHSVRERVSDADLGRELSLPPFPVPEGHRVDDVLSCLWQVVLELEDRECVLCLEQLRRMDGLNAEAEIIGSSAGARV